MPTDTDTDMHTDTGIGIVMNMDVVMDMIYIHLQKPYRNSLSVRPKCNYLISLAILLDSLGTRSTVHNHNSKA
jgi:hypothetical protein